MHFTDSVEVSLESTFPRNAPVLYINPRAHVDPGPWNKREYLLWPAFAYRVVAPIPKKRKINVLQKAVLAMRRAGGGAVREMSSRLFLHEKLVAYILQELQYLGYVNGDYAITSSGLSALSEEILEQHEMVAGYVFQDPETGDLWPRFVDHLDYYCEIELRSDGFPTLIFGSKGKPWKIPAFTVLPKECRKITPMPTDIIRAARRHKFTHRHLGSIEWDEEEFDAETPDPIYIDRVSFLEEEPDPVFLATFLYLGEDAGSSYHVCDPFGMGASPYLRRRVDQETKVNKGLYSVIGRMLDRFLDGNSDNDQRQFAAFRTRAESEIDHLFGVNLRERDVYEYIINVMVSWLDASQYENACPKVKMSNVLSAARKSLESLFVELTREYPLEVIIRKIGRYKGQKFIPYENPIVIDTMEGAAQKFGYSIPTLLKKKHVTGYGIYSAMEPKNSWKLDGRVYGHLLAALEYDTHPMNRAGRGFPDLFEDINFIIKMGGSASHANEDVWSFNEVKLVKDKILKITGILTGLDCDPVGVNSEFRGAYVEKEKSQ